MVRVERLSATAQDVLRVIAVGKRLDDELLTEVTGLPQSALHEALREAVANHIVGGGTTALKATGAGRSRSPDAWTTLDRPYPAANMHFCEAEAHVNAGERPRLATLAKLDVRTRTEAAGVSHRLGLVG